MPRQSRKFQVEAVEIAGEGALGLLETKARVLRSRRCACFERLPRAHLGSASAGHHSEVEKKTNATGVEPEP